MGWTSLNLQGQSPVDYIRQECLTWPYKPGREVNVLAVTKVGSIVYSAVEFINVITTGVDDSSSTSSRVSAIIFLTEKLNPKENQGHNFSYKDMSEDEGPYGAGRCPKAILKLLTPTTSEYANQWRAACRAYHDSKKAVAA